MLTYWNTCAILITTKGDNMLTRIIEWNNQYKEGDKYLYDGIVYTIVEIESVGNLARIYLDK